MRAWIRTGLCALVAGAAMAYAQAGNATIWRDGYTAYQRLNEAAGSAPWAKAAASGRNDTLADQALEYNRRLATHQLELTDELEDQLYQSAYSWDPAGALAYLTVPKLRLVMAVGRGTRAEVLAKGAGHIYGTSLPVAVPTGDPRLVATGSHVGITAHSGLDHIAGFTNLDELVLGDTFSMTVRGQQLDYLIEHIEVVPADELGRLDVQPGRELVTLVTCVPIHINSHRLLIVGSRLPDGSLLPATGVRFWEMPGMPWFAAYIAGAAALGGGYSALATRRARRRMASAAVTVSAPPSPGGHALPGPAGPTLAGGSSLAAGSGVFDA